MRSNRALRRATRVLITAFLLVAPSARFASASGDTVEVARPIPLLPAASPNLDATGDDGTWWPVPTTPVVPPPLPPDIGARQKHSMIYDTANQRFIAFGGEYQPGGTRFNDVWERALFSYTAWVPVTVAGTPPSPRSGHTAVYDPNGHRMLVFGGRDTTLLDEVWQLSLGATPTWTKLSPTGTPPAPRAGHTAVFDAGRNRLVVFGGLASGPMNDVWYLDCSVNPPAWQAVTPAVSPAGGDPPIERSGHAAVYDAAHDRMVVYGGFSGFYYLGDTWTLSFGGTPTWTRRSVVATPPPRTGTSAVIDAVHNRMVVVGGFDVSSIDLTTFAWTSMNSGANSNVSGRSFAAFAVGGSSRAILQGGADYLGASLLDTQWLDLSSDQWALLWPPSPPPAVPLSRRYAAAGVYDPLRNRFLMLAGADDVGSTQALGDICELQIGRDSGWVQVNASPTFTPRFAHSAIYDPLRDRIILFGGYNSNGGYRNDVWQVALSPTLSVSQITPAGTPPLARDYFACVYDPVRDRMLVYGGNNNGTPLGDVWALRFTTSPPSWVNLLPASAPPPARMLTSAIYDPYADRLLVFGGFDGSTSLNDLWGLSLGGTPAWTQLAPAGAPPGARYSPAFQLDPNRQRAVLHGGKNYATNVDYSDEWELQLGGRPLQWIQRSPGGTIPAGRYVHYGVIDPIHDRMLISGGAAAAVHPTDVRRLQWSSDTPTAALLALLSSEASSDRVELRWGVTGGSGMARLERRDAGTDWRTIDSRSADGTSSLAFVDRDVLPGGRYGYRLVVSGAGETSTSDEVWVDVPAGARLALAGFSPNPAPAGAARVAFSLADRSPATIEVVDVTGRRVASERLAAPSPGAGSIAIAPRAALEPGLYFVKLTQGGTTLVRRGSVVR